VVLSKHNSIYFSVHINKRSNNVPTTNHKAAIIEVFRLVYKRNSVHVIVLAGVINHLVQCGLLACIGQGDGHTQAFTVGYQPASGVI